MCNDFSHEVRQVCNHTVQRTQKKILFLSQANEDKGHRINDATSFYRRGRSFVTKCMIKIGLKNKKVLKSKPRPHKLKHGSPHDDDDCSSVKSDGSSSCTMRTFQDSEELNIVDTIVWPYNSSKVRFDLTPQYADGTSGLANARHEKDGDSYLQPGLWYKRMHTNEMNEREMVKKDCRVQKYVECVGYYTQEECMKSGKKETILTMIQSLDHGYRGLEVYHNARTRYLGRKNYLSTITKFAKKKSNIKAYDTSTEGNNDDFLEKLCTFSRMLTASSRSQAYRKAEIDAFVAQME